MATCDPKIVEKVKSLTKRWYDQNGIIVKNLGKDADKFFNQAWWSATGEDFTYGKTPTMAKLRVLEKKINKIENGFTKRTGKIAEWFYLSDEIVKNSPYAKETLRLFQKDHNFYQGNRDKYQSVLNSIVRSLGNKAREMGIKKKYLGAIPKTEFGTAKSISKELQRRYHEYSRITLEEGWTKGEKYFEKNIANLSKDEQFTVFELAENLFRNPGLLKEKPGTYGVYEDVLREWQSIAPDLFRDLDRGLGFYISALKEADKISDGKYSGMIDTLIKFKKDLVERKNYFPVEALNVFPTFKLIQDSLYDRKTRGDTDFKDLTKYVDNIVDETVNSLNPSGHLRKQKTEGLVRRSRDIITVMDNYIRNVTAFNFAGASSDALLKGIRNLQTMKGPEAEAQAEFYSNYLYDTHATMMGLNIKTPFWRTATRAVTSWQFISKLGFNIRGAVRNATQSLQNLVYFGVGGIHKSFFYLRTENIGKIAAEQAKKHGVYFADARELTDSLGLFPELAKTKVNGKELFTFALDSKAQKFTSGLNRFARISGTPMRVVENKVNRQLTFKIAFALQHKMLMNNKGAIKREIEAGLESGRLKLGRDDSAEIYLEKRIVEKAGMFAASAVKELHYEYSPFAKPKVMRTPAGSILGQFMTYSINFFNYQRKIAMQGKDHIISGDWNSEPAWRLYRLGMLYSFLYGILSPLTNTDVGNLVQHDTYERFKNWSDWASGDEEERKRAFFGKGPIIGTVGGPAISDIITLGNVFGFYDLLSNGEADERNMWGYLAGYQDYADSRDSSKLFDLVRTLNTQIGRTAFLTIPRMWNGASFGTVLALESGLHPSKRIKERKLWQIEQIKKYTGISLPKPSFDKKKKRKKAKTTDKNAPVISALDKVIKSAGQGPKSYKKGGKFITSGPEAIIVGDNPSGKEIVTVEPIPVSKGPAKYNEFDMGNLDMALAELAKIKDDEDKKYRPENNRRMSLGGPDPDEYA